MGINLGILCSTLRPEIVVYDCGLLCNYTAGGLLQGCEAPRTTLRPEIKFGGGGLLCLVIADRVSEGWLCTHQVEAGDEVGGNGLRADAERDGAKAAEREQRLDVDAHDVQHHQRAHRHQAPPGQAAHRQQHALQVAAGLAQVLRAPEQASDRAE